MRPLRRVLGVLSGALLLASLLPAANAQWQPGPPSVRGRIGVNAHVPLDEEFALMERLGVGWARIDLTWDFVEPERGRYRWPLLDYVVAQAESHHIRLLGILGYCPPWASSGPDPYYPPRDAEDWERFVSDITSRYQGCIDHWCLWNEPNNDDFFHGSVDDYIERVLIPGSKAAKRAAPGCRIVGPDLAHLRRTHWDAWLEAVLRKAGDRIDIIGHHCYRKDPADLWRSLEGPSWPWEPKPVLDIVRKAGQGDKPVWLTETGWRSDRLGEGVQARDAVQVLDGLGQRPWLAKVFFFELKDSPGDPGYGLARRDCSPKPAFAAVRGWLASSAREEGAGSDQVGHGLGPQE